MSVSPMSCLVWGLQSWDENHCFSVRWGHLSGYCWFLFPHNENWKEWEYCFHLCGWSTCARILFWNWGLVGPGAALPVKAECSRGVKVATVARSRALRSQVQRSPVPRLPHHCQGHMESVAFLKNNIHQETAKSKMYFSRKGLLGTAHISHKSF